MDSFKNIRTWIKNIQLNAADNVAMVLAGTRLEMAEQRQVSTDQGRALAEEFGIDFFECSAREGVNVNELFEALVRKALINFPESAPQQQRANIQLENAGPANRMNKCCS